MNVTPKIFSEEKNTVKYGFLLFVLLIIITAIKSVGYHQPDEHFQILEFCGKLLGYTPLNKMPWEFHAQIRPSIQVWLSYYLLQMFSFLGFENPFHQATLLRLLSSVLSLFTFFQAYKYVKKQFPTLQGVLLIIPFCLWFAPYIMVRFSSETWSGNLFFLGLFYLLNNKGEKNKVLLLVGLLHGLSFLFRFQSGFLVLGFCIWLLKEKKPLYSIMLYLGSIFFCLVGGVLLDYAFYDNWVFTPWNYFQKNILQDKASDFGVEPIWFYAQGILTKGAYLAGSMVLFALGYFLLKKYRSPFFWPTLLFLIGHHLIGHKEERFLFPLLFSLPVILAYAVERYSSLFRKKGFIVFYFVSSVVLGGIVTTKAARIEAAILERYTSYSPDESIILFDDKYFNPYDMWNVTTAFYHRGNKLPSKKVADLTTASCESTGKKHFFVQTRNPKAVDRNPSLKDKCISIYTITPPWITELGLGFQYESEIDRIHTVYECSCE